MFESDQHQHAALESELHRQQAQVLLALREALACDSFPDPSEYLTLVDFEFTSLLINEISVVSAERGQGSAVIEVELAFKANLQCDDPHGFARDEETGKARKLPPRRATLAQVETLEAEMEFEYFETPLTLKIGVMSISLPQLDESLIRFID